MTKTQQQILELAAAGYTPEQVRDELGVTISLARRYFSMFDYGYTKPAPPAPAVVADRLHGVWADPRMVEALLALNKSGEFSMTQMATRLNTEFGTNITRNAVIGKLARLGVPARRYSPARPMVPRRTRRAATKNAPKYPQNPRETSGPTKIKPVPFVVPAHFPPVIARKSLADLNADECKFPVGHPDKEGFGFCAQERVPGLPYCETCCRRAYNKKPPALRRYEAAKREAVPA